MCGILYVKSAASIVQHQHVTAVRCLQRRGPDFLRYRYWPDSFIAHTVLRVSGSDRYYDYTQDHFLAYNGEIYNYQDLGDYDSDIQAMHDMVATQDWHRLRQAQGPWAWIYRHGDGVAYAADPQGERCLYHWRSDDLLIVASDVATILTYVNARRQSVPYENKCWTMLQHTPWQGIERCEPGRLYQDGQPDIMIDTVFDWIKEPKSGITLRDAVDDFQEIWQDIICDMRYHAATISYSGGLDSQLIAHAMPDLRPLSIDILDKDPIAARVESRKIPIDPENWAYHYRALIEATSMPAQSWSHVGKWLVAMHSQDRVIFTGLAADELFGGYDIYRHLTYDLSGSASPYSRHDHDTLWSTCLDRYQGDARQATLLMDYWYQVVGVDAPGHDRLGGAWGRETRNPFMCQRMIKFALNLPWQLKIGSEPKPVLREFYKHTISTDIDPKQGFAGHANDSLPWLGVSITASGNRYQDWKQIAQLTFDQYMSTG